MKDPDVHFAFIDVHSALHSSDCAKAATESSIVEIIHDFLSGANN